MSYSGNTLGRRAITWGGKGINGLDNFKLYSGWYADSRFTRVERGRLAQYDLYGDSGTLETSGLQFNIEPYASLSGNTITMSAGSRNHDFSIIGENFSPGDVINMHVKVLALSNRVGLYYGQKLEPVTVDGIFQIGINNSVFTRQTGEGNICVTQSGGYGRELSFHPQLWDGASDWTTSATIEIDSFRLDYACYKQRTGYCICVFVKYKDEENNIRITPCLISGIYHFTLYGSIDKGINTTGQITTHTFDYMTFYMCSDYNPTLASNRDLVGTPVLDFSNSEPITSKDELFSAVASATGLTVYRSGVI